MTVEIEQKKQGVEQRRQGADLTDLSINVATIATNLTNLAANFREFKDDTKQLIKKVDDVEEMAIKTSERVSNVAIFQGAFSLLIGAIATYLGVKK